MNDNPTTSTETDSTGTPPAPDTSAVPGFDWRSQSTGWKSASYAVLGAPAAVLATPATGASNVSDLVGKMLGGLADAGGTLFAQQPLLATAVAVGLAGAGYRKVKGDLRIPRRSTEGDGFAGRKALRTTLGARQLVKRRGVLRPSLANVPARKVPASAVGTYIGKDRKTGLHLYMAIEDSSVLVAPMGAGKTAKLANWVIDAEGAVVATSSKFDLVEWTELMRARVGRIHIWNPQDVAGRESNLAWDPVIGCADPEHGIDRSMRRAGYLLEGSDATKGVENRTFWESSSYRVLKAFLWAADAAGLTLMDVARWTKQPRNFEAIEIMEKYSDPDPFAPRRPVAPRGWREDLEQVQRVEGKPTTTENVFSTLSQTFMFLDSPRVQEMIEAAHRPGTSNFDIPGFLGSRDTLYMLGRDVRRGGVGPLFTCLTGEVYELARDMASRQKGGRLDPPLSFILDEAALICSVPLQDWTADSRGLGMSIHAVVQSPAQIYERWGTWAYQTIWDNCVKLVMGGLSNVEHLEALSRLCGKRKERRESRSQSPVGEDGVMRESVSYSYVEVDTMAPSDIMNLQPGQILVLRKHLGGPVVATFVPVWERSDVKRAQKEARRRRMEPMEVPAAGGPSSPSFTVPKMPSFAPTVHLEPQPEPVEHASVRLLKTGTTGPFGPGDDEMGAF